MLPTHQRLWKVYIFPEGQQAPGSIRNGFVCYVCTYVCLCMPASELAENVLKLILDYFFILTLKIRFKSDTFFKRMIFIFSNLFVLCVTQSPVWMDRLQRRFGCEMTPLSKDYWVLWVQRCAGGSIVHVKWTWGMKSQSVTEHRTITPATVSFSVPETRSTDFLSVHLHFHL